MQFDEANDFIYIFQATIKNIGGERVALNEELANLNKEATKDFRFEKEYEALQVIKEPEVTFELEFQIWNLDDRLLQPKEKGKKTEPRKQQPIYRHKILLRTELLKNQFLNSFQIMMVLRNKYQSYTSLIMS